MVVGVFFCWLRAIEALLVTGDGRINVVYVYQYWSINRAINADTPCRILIWSPWRMRLEMMLSPCVSV